MVYIDYRNLCVCKGILFSVNIYSVIFFNALHRFNKIVYSYYTGALFLSAANCLNSSISFAERFLGIMIFTFA